MIALCDSRLNEGKLSREHLCWSGVLGRGCNEAEISEEKRLFTEWGPGIQRMKAFGKELYRKGNSMKKFRPFSESPDSKKLKFSVLIPFPKFSLRLCFKSPRPHIPCRRAAGGGVAQAARFRGIWSGACRASRGQPCRIPLPLSHY